MSSSRPMHQIRRCILLHFGYTPGVTSFLRMSTSHEELYDHDPEQSGEGHGEAQQVQEKACDNELAEAGGHEELPDFKEAESAEKGHQCRRIRYDRKEDLQGGEVSDGEHLCRGLVTRGAPAGGFHQGRRGPGVPRARAQAAGDLSGSVAIAEQRSHRHRPSCGLQSLRQARDGDRVRASLNETIVQSQGGLEYRPADRQHLIALGGHAGFDIKRPNVRVASVPRDGHSVPAGIARFRLGVSQQTR